MDSINKSFRNIRQTIFSNNKTKHKKKHHIKKSSSNSSIKLRSNTSSPERKKIIKSIKKEQQKFINVDALIEKVDTLDVISKNMFNKKQKLKPKSKSSSPIILTVKNLNNGKKSKATVFKDLDTGKYEFYQLSNSK